MAGFEVITHGRFWVIAEVGEMARPMPLGSSPLATQAGGDVGETTQNPAAATVDSEHIPNPATHRDRLSLHSKL
jgi:hypothetical protein